MSGWRRTPCGRPAGTCARSRPDSGRCWSSRTPTTSFPERGRAAGRLAAPPFHVVHTSPNEPRGARVTDAMPTTRLIRVDAPVEGHEGVALVTIDRPEALNALSFALLAELADALETLDTNGRTRAAIITGAGDRAFAAGADIVEL